MNTEEIIFKRTYYPSTKIKGSLIIKDDLRNIILQSLLKIQTQESKAKALGITQPRFNDLYKNKLDKFTIESLVMYIERLGFDVKISATKQ